MAQPELTSEELHAEHWKPLEKAFFKEKYMISNMGRIMSFHGKAQHLRTLQVSNYGDLMLMVCEKRKKPLTVMVGLEVAKAFVENPNQYKYIRFKDGNKQNCRASNIEWVELTEKMQKQYEAMQKKVNMYDKNGKYIRTFKSVKDTAEQIGISTHFVYNACKKKFTESDFFFRYADDFPEGQDVEPVKKVLKPLKPVYQYDKQGNFIQMFDSTKDVEIALQKKGIAGTITQCAKGLRPTAYGYIWKFEKEE